MNKALIFGGGLGAGALFAMVANKPQPSTATAPIEAGGDIIIAGLLAAVGATLLIATKSPTLHGVGIASFGAASAMGVAALVSANPPTSGLSSARTS